MIRVEKHNEVYVRVFTDRSIDQELSDFFRFRVKGYQYMPSYKAKMWDGYARLYNLQTKTLYVGLIDYLIEFAKRNDYEIEVCPYLRQTNNISYDDVREFVLTLNLSARGKPIELRDYQVEAVQVALDRGRTLLVSPTASGKSAIIYSSLRWHLNQQRSCIIIVPSTTLVEQLYSDFEDYSTNNGFVVADHCQKLYSGFTKHITKQVLITTWQSIFKQPKGWFRQFDVVYTDEAHLAKASSLTGIMEKMDETIYRVGTTGTLDDSHVNKLTLEGLFGKVYQVTTTRQLMDNSSVAELKIKCIVLKYDDATRKMFKGTEYQKELDWLVTNYERNKFIRNLSISTTGNTLILFNYVDKHGKVLYEMIRNKVIDSRKVFFIHGGIDTQDREEIRNIVTKQGKYKNFTFGDIQIKIDYDEIVPLTNGMIKKGIELTLEDDVDDDWIKSKNV
ncbi:SSL2 DNA or RNA helicases of superfamily II [uncultured Caudovirales phage]|uniref:SSL2 DNA or RNA helicases of superfamily II n=1 Tax=uncultured Caudovirales phage TaxID=2100421 RepID=A0A6J5L1M2_9CAUD|nr:SSL2 DNA or RNA helicases of superfamily II [uncultured Caudovirales phage]